MVGDPGRAGRHRHRDAFPGGLLRLRPGLRLPGRPAARAARPAPPDPAHRGPRGVAGPGRPLRGPLPEVVPGRLAADRHDGRPAVGPGPRPGRPALPRHRGPFHRGVPVTRPQADFPGLRRRWPREAASAVPDTAAGREAAV
ncbi:hypothetical protein SCOCK_170153 [Actinacidiphila cocklensis]|uniref:Uncharacterized protein n=1 Tax=Actinacidiphila cocklensis TaxID=887465 RepID=A0A9W4GPK4_9ACTN|nr:hypothetical protein SCOCK_170153 [Actinacidiphila cocklensis]